MARIRLAAVVLLLALAVLQGMACARPTAPGLFKVTRVIDGDTIEVDGKVVVRYIGIDTPEMSPTPQFFAREAMEYNRKLVGGKEVRLERDVSDTDRYGRLLRYVYVGDLEVNLELVRQGYARARAYPPDTRHERRLQDAQREAMNQKLGIWSPSSITLPFLTFVQRWPTIEVARQPKS